jgi:3,4-dihydroxy 2-butanone 4-phosphate synthase/GTP cyclohydrolase II
MPVSPIPAVLDDLRAGRLIVLVDDEHRENEGDLVIAAERVTPQAINFMTRHTPGYLCLAMTPDDCDRLELHPQAGVNTSLRGTAMAVSIDGHARHGVGTGISASDRARTVQIAVDPRSTSDDLVRPGHMVPLRARDGGVLVRTGQTEGSVDLARLAGLRPAAVISEVCREDGEMARLADLEALCAKHQLKMCSVEQIIEYRLARETLVQRLEPVHGTPIDTPYGRFHLIAYQSTIDALPHLALTVGLGADSPRGASGQEIPLVRVHRRDLLGDIFEEASNPSGRALRASMRMIQQARCGALIYIRPEGLGDDLRSRLQQIRRPLATHGSNGISESANALDLTRVDGVAGRAMPLEVREIGIGGQILRDLGVTRMKLLSNSPNTYPGLHGFGLEIIEQVRIEQELPVA